MGKPLVMLTSEGSGGQWRVHIQCFIGIEIKSDIGDYMRTTAPAAIFIAFAFGTFAAPSFAQDTASDVRCMLVSNLFANTDKNPQAKQVASAAGLFYSGRVSALPNAAIQSGIAAEAKQITAANAAATMNGCAQRMTEGLKQLQAVGGKPQQEKR